jgi:hypothetical protein
MAADRRIGLEMVPLVRLQVYERRLDEVAVALPMEPRKVLEADDGAAFFRHHDPRSFSEEEDR